MVANAYVTNFIFYTNTILTLIIPALFFFSTFIYEFLKIILFKGVSLPFF